MRTMKNIGNSYFCSINGKFYVFFYGVYFQKRYKKDFRTMLKKSKINYLIINNLRRCKSKI